MDFIGSPPQSRDRHSALNHPDQIGSNRQIQRDVDEPAHRLGSDGPENPQHERLGKNGPEDFGSPLLVVIRMRMAPIPVIGLLFLAGPREFVILPVIVGQVDSPGVVLTIIPVVIVLVVGIVYSDLDVSVFGSGSGQNCDRCRQDCGEQKRIDATMCKAHMNILQENSTISVLEQREVKVNLLTPPSVTFLVFPAYLIARPS